MLFHASVNIIISRVEILSIMCIKCSFTVRLHSMMVPYIAVSTVLDAASICFFLIAIQCLKPSRRPSSSFLAWLRAKIRSLAKHKSFNYGKRFFGRENDEPTDLYAIFFHSFSLSVSLTSLLLLLWKLPFVINLQFFLFGHCWLFVPWEIHLKMKIEKHQQYKTNIFAIVYQIQNEWPFY